MTWYHVGSFNPGGPIPEIACRYGTCYDRADHYGSGRSITIDPHTALNLDAPCAHIPVHTDTTGERHIWISNARRCQCGCTGILVGAELNWDDEVSLAGAYTTSGIVQGLSDGIVDCSECHMLFPTGTGGTREFTDPMSLADPVTMCGSCASRYIRTCPDCSTDFRRSDMERITTRDSGGSYVFVCGGCYGMYDRCVHCSNSWNEDSSDYCCNSHPDGNNAYLPNCTCYTCQQTRYGRTPRVIRNYSYKPDPEFRVIGPERRFGKPNEWGDRADTTLYLGFELEVEVTEEFDRAEVAAEMQSALGDVVYLKEDGSIDCGFEIVSHPMTLEYAMANVNWAAIRQMRKARKLRSADNCGLHVHVSKAAFSGPAHEYRWLLFWHRNQTAMRALAGRDSSYAQYRDDQRSQFADIVRKRPAYSERYSAINTNNRDTHEVRVFASTLYVNRLKASLQLVEATVEYTRSLAASKVLKDGGFSWHEFVVWLTGNARRYADLLERIRTVVKLTNSEPIVAETGNWGVRNQHNGYVDRWITKNITIQEKATA